MNSAYIVDAIRTPIGSFGGSLAPVRADDLAAHVLKALMARHPELDPAVVEDVILGCANQAGEDNRNVARMALLLAGMPVSVPGETVNRLCASGMGAVVNAGRAMVVLKEESGTCCAPPHEGISARAKSPATRVFKRPSIVRPL